MKKKFSIITASLIVVWFAFISPASADSVSIAQYGYSLTQAITDIGTAQKTLYIDGGVANPATMSGPTTTVPSNISIIMEYPGSIDISGKTLTINGSFSAGSYNVFTGNGTVKALTPITAYPEWFGAGASKTTTINDFAIKKVFAMIPAGSTVIFYEVYPIPMDGHSKYNINVSCILEGNNIGGISRVEVYDQNSNFIVNADYVTIRNMRFEATHTGKNADYYAAVDIKADHCTVTNCLFMGAAASGVGSVGSHIQLCDGVSEAYISNNRFYDAFSMIYLDGYVTNSIIDANYFTGGKYGTFVGAGIKTGTINSRGNVNITIQNNSFVNCTQDGIDTALGGLAHGRIMNNYFYSIPRALDIKTEYHNPGSTSVYETALNRFITIAGNTFDSNENDIVFTSGFYDGITPDEAWATRFILVEGNQFLNTNATGNSVVGGAANNVIFSDNLFFNSKGLVYTLAGNNIKFTKNIVYSAEPVVEMFRFNDDNHSLFFTDNYFYGSNYAVFVLGPAITDMNISNNYFGMSNPYSGIIYVPSGVLKGMHINNNTFERTSGTGYSVISIGPAVSSVSSMFITNNTVRNFTRLFHGGDNTNMDNIIIAENILENAQAIANYVPTDTPAFLVRDNIPPIGAGVSADAGNNDFTYSAQASAHTILYDTPVTANRTITLSNHAAANGYRVRVVRTANCTGAYNINVGTGPLKAMGTPGSWADFEYNGTTWMVTGYGTL